jgi:hypothetical protein
MSRENPVPNVIFIHELKFTVKNHIPRYSQNVLNFEYGIYVNSVYYKA